MIIQIGGDLWQWDTGRTVQITVDEESDNIVSEVHFFNRTTPKVLVSNNLSATDEGVTVKIPDILLQTSGDLVVYAVTDTDEGKKTFEAVTLTVKKKAKPEDYVYTETEIFSWYTLERRIEVLERSGGTGGTGLPYVTEADNGKFLQVVNGLWEIVPMPLYDGELVVTPAVDADQTLLTAQKFLDSNIKVEKVPYYEVSNNSGGLTATIGSEV